MTQLILCHMENQATTKVTLPWDVPPQILCNPLVTTETQANNQIWSTKRWLNISCTGPRFRPPWSRILGEKWRWGYQNRQAGLPVEQAPNSLSASTNTLLARPPRAAQGSQQTWRLVAFQLTGKMFPSICPIPKVLLNQTAIHADASPRTVCCWPQPKFAYRNWEEVLKNFHSNLTSNFYVNDKIFDLYL